MLEREGERLFATDSGSGREKQGSFQKGGEGEEAFDEGSAIGHEALLFDKKMTGR